MSAEKWLLDTVAEGEMRVFIYNNGQPTVALGRNQNPWKECNVRVCHNYTLERETEL